MSNPPVKDGGERIALTECGLNAVAAADLRLFRGFVADLSS